MAGSWKQTLACFGIAASAGFAVAGVLLLREPQGYGEAAPYIPLLSDAAICKAPREDMAALTRKLPAAAFMNLEKAHALVQSQNAATDLEGGTVALEKIPGDNTLYALKWHDGQGREHRTNGPAALVFDAASGRAVMEIWAQNGTIHRDGGLPATTEWDEQGRVTLQTWREKGQLHNATGPAYRAFDWNNDTLTQTWHLEGLEKRMDESQGPTHTQSLISSGLTFLEEWAGRTAARDRLVHRHDGLHILEHDKLTGAQTRAAYNFHGGKSHSDQMVYEITSDGLTGAPRREEWRKNNEIIGAVDYHANGLPATYTPGRAMTESLRRMTQELMASGGGHHDHNHHQHGPNPSH